jgi:hypothetical protein
MSRFVVFAVVLFYRDVVVGDSDANLGSKGKVATWVFMLRSFVFSFRLL